MGKERVLITVKTYPTLSVKYVDQFIATDLHFFLGTTQQFHFVAPNPWGIIGVFPIPRQIQPDLF
ncbi:MAG: hypothetical protein H7A45_05215 [Verrucomicrobiales bacterium]|nr:hypothetical protein [Verrucomicrobiales bacterium]MCP5524872.1 hypothetical protein [Verrucomicrobiales bacterium]